MAELVTTNAKAVALAFNELSIKIAHQQGSLFKQMGAIVVNNVKERIKSQDEGRWAKMSKWTSAKKNPARVLEGAEEFVKFRATSDKLEIISDTKGEWTLSQHHEGFENKEDHREGDKIVIDIINPGPLGLTSVPDGKFSWIPRAGTHLTPARKIWPTEEETKALILPIASKWLNKLIADTMGGGITATIE